ncbi:hypothetical protein DH2020_043518 [Rehmannia glutinosa]|uniref:Reverse transcriptase Ty1/copia-type domain-containing protein n=1 Tax=Rehmannia glutinosa TaxID=99300 RepID=A0ABR0UJE3_REHGL
MRPPEGYLAAKPGQVCLLKKSLYGLKQASREWNTAFCGSLIAYGFRQSSHDHCLFLKGDNTSFLALLVYVDDVLLTGSNESDIAHLKHYLDGLFTIKDLGYAKYFLGVEIARSEQGTYLCQRKYILDILRDTKMMDCKVASTPLPPGIKLIHGAGTPLSNPEQFRRLIGRLLYLNFTRPDIAFATQQLSQFVGQPHTSHWEAALHVLRYLKGCPSVGLFYSVSAACSLTAYSDADWGTCPDTRKSLTGYCVFYGNCLISWKTKKQTTVSRSSAEAEYRALGTTVCELQWLYYIAQDLQLSLPTPIDLWCDNQAAMHIVANPVFHERTKHLDIDCHIVRNKFKDGFLLLKHVTSRHQLADIFTKALGCQAFQRILSKFGLQDFLRSPT